MNDPTTFQRSSSWTLQSYLKKKDSPQGDEQDDDWDVPKTDFLRGFSGFMNTSAALDVLPHEVHEQESPKAIKRVSIISSASEIDTRGSESEDDDSWIDALCEAPVGMFDAIEPLPVFQDLLATPSHNQSRKQSVHNLHNPTIVTPAKSCPLRRVSMEGFLLSETPSPSRKAPPSAPKKAPRPSSWDNVASPEATFKPSQLFTKNAPHEIKKEPTIKVEQTKEPFPNISSSGRVRKAVKLFDPQDFEMPRKEPSKKKRKMTKDSKTVNPESFSSSEKSNTLVAKNARTYEKKNIKSFKAIKAGRSAVRKCSRPLVLTPTKIKNGSVANPPKLSELPKIVQCKTFSDKQAASWDRKYQEFLDFKEFYGHTAVPHFYTPNLKLSRWVKRQRYQYKLRLVSRTSTMTNKRIVLLNQAGFIWDSHYNVWMERYRELKDFVKDNGHASVTASRKSKKNSCLAAWVKHQRRQYKLLKMGYTSHMTQERVDLLDKIGFKWFVRPSYQTTPKGSQRKSTRQTVPPTEELLFEDFAPDQVGSIAL